MPASDISRQLPAQALDNITSEHKNSSFTEAFGGKSLEEAQQIIRLGLEAHGKSELVALLEPSIMARHPAAIRAYFNLGLCILAGRP